MNTKEYIIAYAIERLKKAIFWLKGKAKRQENSVISLAPKVLTEVGDIKVIQPYLDELESSLETSDLTNIAVAGTYGSGKSTIIKTFQYLHPEYEYLNISLASFNENEENGKKLSSKEEVISRENEEEIPLLKAKKGIEQYSFNTCLERRLEISILQQIFYHVKPSEIPDSRFKRIKNNKWWQLLLTSLSIIIWLISVIILFKFDYIDKLNPSLWSFPFKLSWITFLSFACFFAGVGFFTKYVVRLFSNSKINKFSIRGELELGDNIDKSVFNEHLEEILYFFERTLYNVVIIEDLDRFDTTDIFTKLRELNILLNTSKLIKRDVNFIYAIKDELFTDKNERVKFFDYIIPIIPFINASNAGVKLNELVKKRRLDNALTSDFIQDIVSFIDDIDMRLLINIFHEFCIYRENIPVENQDNLFAMIVYKNMYPDDFGKLSKHSGFLYNFVSNKNKYISELSEVCEKEIKRIESKINDIDKGRITSVQELRTMYLFKLQIQIPGITAIYIDNQKIGLIRFLEDEYFTRLLEYEKSQIKYDSYGYGLRSSSVTFASIAGSVSPIPYKEREELVLGKADNTVDKLRREIMQLKNKKKEIESKSLQELFQEIDIEPYLEGFSNNQMMRTLLINGYLNEDYEDYISLFHEGNTTRADETFKRKIKSGKASPFDYQLSEKIGNLIKEIPEKYFKREVILNFNLLDFLSDNISQYKAFYSDIMSILSNEKDNSIEFIEEYIERGRNLPLFVKSISHSWSNWWYYYMSKYEIHDEKLKKYLRLIIEYADEADILLLNVDSKLSEYISTLHDFISLIGNLEESKVRNLISKLNIKFKQLASPDAVTKSLFNYMYENDFYEINDENISIILFAHNNSIDKQSLVELNYSTISDSGCKFLIDYIEKDITIYINKVFLRLEKNTKEKESSIISLLNKVGLSIAIKTDVVLKQEILITDISSVPDNEVQQMLINKNKIAVTWRNVYLYYKTLQEGSDLDEVLVEYLNKKDNSILLSEQAIGTELKGQLEDVIKSFSLKIIGCNELKYENYIKLIKSTPYRWNRLNFENLDEDKVEWMVNNRFLVFTVDNFNKLKKKFPEECIIFMEEQLSEMFSIFKQIELDKNDILSLLKSTKITANNKIEIINSIDDRFIIENGDIAELTCNALVASKKTISLTFDVIKSLLNSSSTKENKVKLLNKRVEGLQNSQLQDLTEQLGCNYQKLFKKRNKPIFANTEYNKTLFNYLQDRGLIRRYEKYKDDLRVFANY